MLSSIERFIPIDVSLCKSTGKNLISGVYKIVSPSGGIYIGYSVDIEGRFYTYKKMKWFKSQRKLYASFKKHGVLSHYFEIVYILNCDNLSGEEVVSKLHILEIYYIKVYNSYHKTNKKGLNLTKGGDGMYISSEIRISWRNFMHYDSMKIKIKKNPLTKNIKTPKEWNKIKHKLPKNIPKSPLGVYINQGTWRGWGDFLGNENYRSRVGDFYDYDKGKEWNKNIGKIITVEEWNETTSELPLFIPKNPASYYSKKGTWKGWGDFLGTGRLSNSNFYFYEYEKCKAWSNADDLTKNIKTKKEWMNIIHLLPDFIPKYPDDYYGKKGTWKGWSKFLNSGRHEFKTFIECFNWVKENDLTKNLNSRKDWDTITDRLPSDIPKTPQSWYKKTGEWKGWGHFLRNDRKREGDFYVYKKAKKWKSESDITKKVTCQNEWNKIKHLLPSFIPKAPQYYYKKNGGWISWGNFLGTGVIAPQLRVYYTISKAKKWLKKGRFKNINSETEWRKITKLLPSFIPKNPYSVYKRQGTWNGWKDFLGTD